MLAKVFFEENKWDQNNFVKVMNYYLTILTEIMISVLGETDMPM